MRVFIASADSTFRLAFQMLLDSEPGMVVIGISDRAEDLSTQVEAAHAEVLLLDWELAKQTTIDLIGDLQQLKNRPEIITLAINPQVKDTALAAGASAFISKDVPPDELLPILRKIRSRVNTV